MDESFVAPLALILWVAIAVVGNIEIMKSLTKTRKIPSWLYALSSVLLCCGYMAAAQFIGHWVVYVGDAISVTKFCHSAIIDGLPRLIGGVMGAVGRNGNKSDPKTSEKKESSPSVPEVRP